MSNKRPVVVLAGLFLAGAGAACSGGGEAGSPDGLPRFVAGYAATCTDGAGFGGAPSYEAGEDPGPIVFLSKPDDSYFVLDPGLDDGVVAAELSDADDAGEQARLAAISVVACLAVTSTEATGQTCEYEGDDGGVITLDHVDAVYELVLHEAATGEEIDSAEIEVAAADVECPIVTSIDDGQTEMTPSADPADVQAAIEAALDA